MRAELGRARRRVRAPGWSVGWLQPCAAAAAAPPGYTPDVGHSRSATNRTVPRSAPDASGNLARAFARRRSLQLAAARSTSPTRLEAAGGPPGTYIARAVSNTAGPSVRSARA